MKAYFLLAFFLSGFQVARASGTSPCSAGEASQFDFWVGTWDAVWSDSLRGSNTIQKIYGNCTIHESFSDSASGFFGQSWSVYNAQNKMWQQTWVDNQGGYIVLTGGMVGDSMILTTAERTVPLTVSKTGKSTSRMVFYNIQPNSFDWSWESSADGITWKPNWRIHYSRKM